MSITSQADLDTFLASETYTELVSFIVDLQESVTGLPNDSDVSSSVADALVAMLAKIDHIISQHPVVIDKDTSRFGKVEFRDFYDALGAQCETLAAEFHASCGNTSDTPEALVTCFQYLRESFGNRTRIDYGSGHELNLMCFLFCLHKLGYIEPRDYPAVILQAFTSYMAIMRRLQKTYWLEPAGSHGVWGLDDYHFLPFLFGAAQLASHPHMTPKSIHNEELVEMFYKNYMYLECIHFINSIKTLPKQGKLSLRWHSPMLDDISAAKSWTKIKEGMVKMYKAEVLSKLPIMQHFMFGEVIRCPEGIDASTPTDNCGHVHANTWGDCCGIKIPSAVAASESIRRGVVPFD